MTNFIRNILKGMGQVAFPNVCVCCGNENTQNKRQICSFCLEERFQDANPENRKASSDTLLPEGICFQHALWQFDKGGDLQHLLHQLKYERLTTIGIDLGRKLGERICTHPQLNKILTNEDAILLPVPLHYLKFRYRGFNQAFKIACGFQELWNEIPICEVNNVVRSKNTSTQTGFSLQKRLKNMEGAFKVKDTSAVKNKLVVIIDDVFTTGATTFELARTLLEEGAKNIAVLTIAQA